MASIGGFVRGASKFSSDRWLYAWALGYAAIGAASLLIPVYALTLGSGPFIVGALEATAGLAGVPGALIWGRLADKTGQRRGFVLISLAGSGLALAVFPFLEAISVLLALNTVLWFLVAAATPVVTLFMIENTPEREWEQRIGLLNAYQGYGWVGGLVAGTVWLGLGTQWFTPLFAQQTFFFLCAAGALLATPLAFYWLPPEATVSGSRLARSPRSVYRIVTGSARYVKLVPFAPSRALFIFQEFGSGRFLGRFSGSLRRYFLVVFLFSIGFTTFFGPAPAYLTDLGYTSSLVFVFFILASLASAIVFVPVGKLVADRRPKLLQLQALGVRTLLFLAIGLLGLLAHAILRGFGLGVGFVLIGITWAIVAVTAAGIVSRSAKPSIRGEALGMYAAISGIGGGIGGLLGGYAASVLGYQVAFGIAGAIVFLGFVLLVSIGFQFEVERAVPVLGSAESED